MPSNSTLLVFRSPAPHQGLQSLGAQLNELADFADFAKATEHDNEICQFCCVHAVKLHGVHCEPYTLLAHPLPSSFEPAGIHCPAGQTSVRCGELGKSCVDAEQHF